MGATVKRKVVAGSSTEVITFTGDIADWAKVQRSLTRAVGRLTKLGPVSSLALEVVPVAKQSQRYQVTWTVQPFPEGGSDAKQALLDDRADRARRQKLQDEAAEKARKERESEDEVISPAALRARRAAELHAGGVPTPSPVADVREEARARAAAAREEREAKAQG